MKILLSGATGFVGGFLYETLKKEEYEISLILRGERKLQSSKYFYFNSLNKDCDFESVLEGQDVVLHLAAKTGGDNYDSADSLSDFRSINTEGTLNLASQAAKAGVKRFIFLSTIKVSGESTSNGTPFTAFESRRPETPYGQSKAEAEEQLLELGKETGMEIVIIRPPLVYGEGVKANFASLMNLVAKGIPLPFRAIANNKRSLVSVYNLVDLIKVCINHPSAANQVFLVSDDDDMSTARMVALMAKAQGKANLSLPVPVWCFKLMGKLFIKEAVVDRLVGSLQLDIEHTKNTLDWVPPYSAEHGFALAAKKKD